MITVRQYFKFAVALLLIAMLVCPPAQALVTLNDGHDHLFVTGSMSLGWNSNVYATSAATSDYNVSTSIVADYQRRAGWIGVNASVGLQAARYNVLTRENFNNPRFSLELTKQTGRTTGSFTLNAARDSRADAAVNMRTTTWNYDSGLNFRYPLVGIYTLSGQVGYSEIRYVDNTFPTLNTYSASADLIRIFSTERDVMLGYRYRHSQTAESASFDDNAFTVGMTGKLIRGLNGSLRAGYQLRTPHPGTPTGRSDSKYSSWTASGSATYPVNKRLNFTGSLAKDFSVTANTMSVDTTSIVLDMQYAYSSHWTLSGSASLGDTKFVGEETMTTNTPDQKQRHDQFVAASISLAYSLNEHLKIAASYAWFKNSSNVSTSSFLRTSYNLNLSSHW